MSQSQSEVEIRLIRIYGIGAAKKGVVVPQIVTYNLAMSILERHRLSHIVIVCQGLLEV